MMVRPQGPEGCPLIVVAPGHSAWPMETCASGVEVVLGEDSPAHSACRRDGIAIVLGEDAPGHFQLLTEVIGGGPSVLQRAGGGTSP